MAEQDTKTITVKVTLELVDGKARDAETLIDYFAAAIGEQNGAGANAMKLGIHAEDEDRRDDGERDTYKVVLVDA